MTEDKSKADAADQDQPTPHRALTMFLLGLVLGLLVALVGWRCPSDKYKCCGPGWWKCCYGTCVLRGRRCP
jgi:hypothetical protein